MSTAMIAITTSSSTSVKPWRTTGARRPAVVGDGSDGDAVGALMGWTPDAVGDEPSPEDPLIVGGFGSDHAGGIVVAGMGDGSVRFLTPMMSPGLLRQLGHRADGELPASE